MLKENMDFLKKLREDKGLSYEDMGKILGISKSYYWQIEHKNKRLYYDMAKRISKVFNLKPDDLFYDEFLENKETKSF